MDDFPTSHVFHYQRHPVFSGVFFPSRRRQCWCVAGFRFVHLWAVHHGRPSEHPGHGDGGRFLSGANPLTFTGCYRKWSIYRSFTCDFMVILDMLVYWKVGNCLYFFIADTMWWKKTRALGKSLCTQNRTTVTTYMAGKNIIVSSVILFSVGHQDLNLI